MQASFFDAKINCTVTERSTHRSIDTNHVSLVICVNKNTYDFQDSTLLAFFSLSQAYKKEL